MCNMSMITYKVMVKERKVYAIYMDLEKILRDCVDWEAMLNVSEVHEAGKLMLDGVKAFYREASTYVKEVCESFRIHGCLTQRCVVSPWLSLGMRFSDEYKQELVTLKCR